MRVLISRLKASAAALWEDTQGIILPYVTILLVIFVGVGALALDGRASDQSSGLSCKRVPTLWQLLARQSSTALRLRRLAPPTRSTRS